VGFGEAGWEGIGLGGVVVFDDGHDLRRQLRLGAPDAVVDRPVGENPEPDLDLVEPGGVGGCEVEVEAAPALGPGEDGGVLVNAEIVENDVQVTTRDGGGRDA
jgi:hypothetical protein